MWMSMLQPQIHWKQQRKAGKCPTLLSGSKLRILFCLSHQNLSLFQILQKATSVLTLCWFVFFNSNMISNLISHSSLRGFFLSLALKKLTGKHYECKQEHSLPAWNMRTQTAPVFSHFLKGLHAFPPIKHHMTRAKMGGWYSPTWNTHTCRKFKIIQRSAF